MIVRCSIADGLLEVRVPPVESSSQSETNKTVYQFFTKTLDRHVPTWAENLTEFGITKTYKKLLKNRRDFCLRQDTPESSTVRIAIARKGKLAELDDLRDDEMWDHEKGFSRFSMRGAWEVDERIIFMHLNYDKFKIGRDSTVKMSRLYIPDLCNHEDLVHAIQRLQKHF